jgi:dethiobiotin synthase
VSDGVARILVVTGTDTGVGKTVATAALAATLPGTVTVYKPTQAGTENGEGDVDVVRRLTGLGGSEGVRLPDPMAPVAAARRAGVRLPEIAHHVEAVRRLAATHDHVLVEGAGGLLVELDEEGHTLADLAAALAAPVVVVCRSGLGTLNHTALTVEALRRRGITLAGVLIGSWPADPTAIERDNRRHLERYGLLGALPAEAGLLTRADFLRALQETPDERPREHQDEDQQRHREEAPEGHPAAEHQVHGLQDDELAAEQHGPQQDPGPDPADRGGGRAEAALHPLLRRDDDLEHALEQDRRQEREREGLTDDLREVLDEQVQDDRVDEDVHDPRCRPLVHRGQS